jgi:hypothetical protein
MTFQKSNKTTPTIHPEVIGMRRRAFMAMIGKEGGAYLLPANNQQPDPLLKIASIQVRGIQAFGHTEAEAQDHWFRQACTKLVPPTAEAVQ